MRRNGVFIKSSGLVNHVRGDSSDLLRSSFAVDQGCLSTERWCEPVMVLRTNGHPLRP